MKQLDMKGIPFLLIVLLGITALYTWMDIKKGGEGFISVAMGKANVKTHVSEGFQNPIIPKPLAPLKGMEPELARPGAIPSAPYNATAATSPTPYMDPALATVSLERIKTVVDNLKGFLSFEAPLLRGQSDPTVQLPLTTAKADLPRLESEMVVMQRNPGLPSSLTGKALLDVESNMRYLRDKYRILHASGALNGQPTSFLDSAVPARMVEGFETATTNLTAPSERATLADLKSARDRMMAERSRLSASATNDPVISRRIDIIGQMITDLNMIIDKVQTGTLLEIEIPIMKDTISKIFTAISNPNEPIPALFNQILPPSLMNLLPPNLANDVESQTLLRNLADKYGGSIVNGLSWEVNASAKYTAPNEAANNPTINLQFGPQTTGEDALIALNSALGSSTPGFPTENNLFNSSTSANAQPTPAPGTIRDPYAVNPIDGMGRTPSSGFDWKRRAKEICEAIRRMGMDPKDFGCMEEGTQVSGDFSWKGYARMICNRLQTNYYTGTAEACGCPPLNWTGW